MLTLLMSQRDTQVCRRICKHVYLSNKTRYLPEQWQATIHTFSNITKRYINWTQTKHLLQMESTKGRNMIENGNFLWYYNRTQKIQKKIILKFRKVQ